MSRNEDHSSGAKKRREFAVFKARHKIAEQRLKESEKKYSLITEETGQLIYDYDLATGLIEWSGAIEEVIGYPPEEFNADIRTWKALIHPEDRARIQKIRIAARKAAERFNAEYRFLAKNGSYRFLRDTGVYLTDRNGKPRRMLGTITDVSKKKESENALEQSLSLLQATLESTADGILAVDRKGDVLITNQKFLDMWDILSSPKRSKIDSSFLKHARSQLINPKKFLPPPNSRRTRPSMESYDLVEFKDGRVYEQYSKPQKIKQRIIGRVWSFRDVTEQKRSEKVKTAVYKISGIANMAETLDDLFLSIHAVISKLMPARNFYIALYNAETQLLSFPYFVDEIDDPPPPEPLKKGLTAYVFRHGEPLLINPEKYQELNKAGEVEVLGTPCIDWLGVPLKVKGRTIGVMVVQTYSEGVRYTEENKAIMMFVSAQAALAIERKQTEERLREAQRFLSNVFSSIQDGIIILDPELNIIQTNPAIEKWFAQAMPFLGKKCYEVFYGRRELCANCPARETLRSGEPSQAVVMKMGPQETEAGWFDLYTFPLIDSATGKMKGVIEYSRDITTRRQTEEALRASLLEKEVLLKEIHHRVKNNMQIITSLLSLQARHLEDKKAIEMFKESQHRIRSMALVHEKLYQSKDLSHIDFAKYIENLMIYLFHSYQIDSSHIGLRIEVDDIQLDINTAIPCGLIINELVSNSLKHAFPGGRRGEIRVELRPINDFQLKLTVGDNGIGLPQNLDVYKTQTLGMQLVVMLVDQLESSLGIERKPGTSFSIIFQKLNYSRRI